MNSEHSDFGIIASEEHVFFHKRPEELGNDTATHEQFVYEFLTKHSCEYLFQVHSIAPLLTSIEIVDFVNDMLTYGVDAMLSIVEEQIECAVRGKPVNFTFDKKNNSQDLDPLQRIIWSITGWRMAPFVTAVEAGKCATYAGQIGFHPVSRVAGHVIKFEFDLQVAEALLPLLQEDLTSAV